MILNVRGTSGSGKSTAVRAVMNLAIEEAAKTGRLGVVREMAQAGFDPKRLNKKRKNPLLYRCNFDPHVVSVLGSYEADCGGCDSLPSYEVTFGLVRAEHDAGNHVLLEGLLLSHDKKQFTALWEHLRAQGKGEQLVILELTETLGTCLNSVRERRARKGADPEFNTANTERRYKEVVSSCKQLEERGISVVRVTRAAAVPTIIALMGLQEGALAA